MSNPKENDNGTIQVIDKSSDLDRDRSVNSGLKMGKTIDGDVDKLESGNAREADNKNEDHTGQSSTEQEKMDSPKTETKLLPETDKCEQDVNSADVANEDDANEAQDQAAKTMSVEIKDKSPKQTDDINHFDSVSNIKSQPDRGREIKKDVKISGNMKPGKSDSFVQSQNNSNAVASSHQTPRLKKMKKGIFVSYSPDAGFLERRFVVEAVRQLKENNLADDIWFDKDERNTDSPCWFSMRMEAVEKCRAAVLVLSDSYFTCPVSLYEGKTLIERTVSDPNSVKVFPVLFRQPDPSDVPKHFSVFLESAIDLTGEHVKKSAAEKTSVVVGTIMEELEKYATMHTAPLPVTPPDSEFTGEFRKKKICQWSASDLQEWLFNLGIKEFYRQSLAEAMVDGFLLMSLTDHDMVTHLGIESRVVRKKIMQQILQTLDREHKHPDNWHLRSRALRPKPDVVYIIYDPADVRLAQNLKADLKWKNMQVIHHDTVKLGRSKEEFLQINGPSLATASHVVVVMTDAASGSPFIFHEVLFADWLGKKLVTAMFKNVWTGLRASLKAVLGDCPAVDFESQMYTESLDVLEHQIRPLRRVPGVVLEQTYLNKMAEGLKPLEVLASLRGGAISTIIPSDEDSPQVFISYQWDMQSKVDELQQILERAGFPCWADIAVGGATSANHASSGSALANNGGPRGHSSRSSRSSHHSLPHHHHSPLLSAGGGGAGVSSGETLQGQIQRTMKACSVVVCCITPKYLQSDNCAKDLALADALHKPVIPLLLRYAPAESAPNYVRRILLRYSYVDLSNERLYKQNVGVLVERVRKVVDSSMLR
ncbi:Bf-TIR-SAM-like protein [Elysia marginata]|uniref:Bf-TIR-SAM-like protein n=1 Tax=Elysia marginata TaxID=1093978 RepID=A0AAV4HZ54_9GAST|nr:Bf-TIR-SAM-like protein [Elysia marginata]